MAIDLEELARVIRSHAPDSKERAGFKVIVGGAPLTASWAREIGADGYAEDAATGARRALELVGAGEQTG